MAHADGLAGWFAARATERTAVVFDHCPSAVGIGASAVGPASVLPGALSASDLPTLVLTGDADRLIPPENSERLAARIPDATLRMVRGAGHDVPTERPAEVAELVLDFLGGASHAQNVR